VWQVAIGDVADLPLLLLLLLLLLLSTSRLSSLPLPRRHHIMVHRRCFFDFA
jgi:hypothetical protein